MTDPTPFRLTYLEEAADHWQTQWERTGNPAYATRWAHAIQALAAARTPHHERNPK